MWSISKMAKYVIVKNTQGQKKYRTYDGAWIEIKDAKTNYPLKTYVDIEDAEVGKNYIEHKEREKGLSVETLNIKQMGY